MPSSVPDPVLLGDVEPGHRADPFPGVARRTVQTATATVAIYRFEPHAAFPRHRHPEEQITVILEGAVELQVGDSVHAVGAGETHVVGPDRVHSLKAGPCGAAFLAIVIPRRSHPDAYRVAEPENGGRE